MNIADIVIIGILVLICGYAIYSVISDLKSGKCIGCALTGGCHGNCSHKNFQKAYKKYQKEKELDEQKNMAS